MLIGPTHVAKQGHFGVDDWHELVADLPEPEIAHRRDVAVDHGTAGTDDKGATSGCAAPGGASSRSQRTSWSLRKAFVAAGPKLAGAMPDEEPNRVESAGPLFLAGSSKRKEALERAFDLQLSGGRYWV